MSKWLLIASLTYVAADVFGAFIFGKCFMPGLKCPACREEESRSA